MPKGKKLITEKDVREAAKAHRRTIAIDVATLITPLARDVAKAFGITFDRAGELQPKLTATAERQVAIGSDHSGFSLKSDLIGHIEALGMVVTDVGTFSSAACDYPDYAEKVGDAVRLGKVQMGIMIDGVGTASAIVLNKMTGIRAASCYTEFTAQMARGHGNANVLTLGARALGSEVIKRIVTVFLITPFEGERHLQRLEKVARIEDKFMR